MPTSDQLDKIMGRIKRLPPLPENITRINNLIDNHKATTQAIGLEISKDQSLSAQVLRLINSSFYGFSNSVSSIPHAVVLLGLNAVRSLVSSSWVAGIIANSFPGIYEHCLACARTCCLLSRALGLDEPEEMSTVGLLHDIGKVALAQYLPDQFHNVRQTVTRTRLRFCEAEMEALGVTHADIGRRLLENWSLPRAVVEPIGDHHGFVPDSDYARRTALLILADAMVKAEGFGWSGDNIMPALSHAAMDLLAVHVEDLHSLMNEMADQMRDISRHQERPAT